MKTINVHVSDFGKERLEGRRFTMLHFQAEPNATLIQWEEGEKPQRVFSEDQVKAAIESEPELPDDMPDEMWEACRNDRDVMQEALRVVVRLTKEGIAKRHNITL